jgi:hypothetical protein
MDTKHLLEQAKESLKNRDNQAGLYLTVSFHLILLIIFLSYSINTLVQAETSFVFDFTGIEHEEEVKRIEEVRKSVAEEVDALLNASRGAQVRNVAVNANRSGEQLRDDRSKNPSEVYDEARRLQAKLDASRREALKAQDSEEDVATQKGEYIPENQEVYRGPAVISFRLANREGMNLKVPAYKCQGAGDVTVAIVVDRKGNVKTAKIIDAVSSTDNCLREYATKAAKQSRFTASSSAPERQAGEIVYRFIAQ